MTSLVANVPDFLLNTDYPLDKVVFLNSGSITFAVSGTDYIFAHGLPFTPLIKVTWSTSADFSTTYGVGDGPVSTDPNFPFLPQLTLAYADSTNVTLSFGNPGSVATAYIRVYAMMPTDVEQEVDFTANAADSFVLNTDYNYTKLYMSGVTSSSSTPGSSEFVTHNLNYYPQVEVWFTKGSSTYATSFVQMLDGVQIYESFEISTTDLTMRRDPSLATTEYFHYRIYADRLE